MAGPEHPAGRFSGVAAEYDQVRPAPPAAIAEVIRQWAGIADPDVVDLGAGTGLSAALWAGRARQVTAVEPSAPIPALLASGISEDELGLTALRESAWNPGTVSGAPPGSWTSWSRRYLATAWACPTSCGYRA